MTSLRIAAILFVLGASSFADEVPTPSARPDRAVQRPRTTPGARLAPKVFQSAVEKARPWIVKIETFGGQAASASQAKTLGWVPGEGPSTGVVISEDGWILTSAFHFLTKPTTITATTPDGKRRVARLVGRDETRQLALLKVDGVSQAATPTPVPRDELKVGQWAVAAGFGFGGDTPSLTAGVISAKSRISTKAIQTDANLSPANYGGPLLDIEGRLIGICSPVHPQAQQAGAGAEWYDSGIGFAIPWDSVEKVLDRLKEGKTLELGALGVQVQAQGDPPLGAHVQQVIPGAGAEKAGIKTGDEIAAVDGKDVIDQGHLTILLGAYVAGDKVPLTIVRDEEEIEIVVELTPRKNLPAPTPPGAPKLEPKPSPPKE